MTIWSLQSGQIPRFSRNRRVDIHYNERRIIVCDNVKPSSRSNLFLVITVRVEPNNREGKRRSCSNIIKYEDLKSEITFRIFEFTTHVADCSLLHCAVIRNSWKFIKSYKLIHDTMCDNGHSNPAQSFPFIALLSLSFYLSFSSNTLIEFFCTKYI